MKVLGLSCVVGTVVAGSTCWAQGVVEVDEIVVSAGEEKVASEVPQSVSVVDQEELDAQQASAIGEALDQLPGVTVSGSSSFLGQSFNIRGVGSGGAADEPKIIKLLDGVEKYYEQYRMGSLFVDTELLKRVEVLRGPGSSTLYGTGAMGGVVAMETKDAADFLEGDDRFAVRQKLSYETNARSPASTTIFAIRPNDNTDILASLSLRYIDTTRDGNDDDLVITNAVTPSGLLKFTRYMGDHTFEASYQHLHSSGEEQDYNQLNGGWGVADRDVTDKTATAKWGFAPTDNPLIDLEATLAFSDTYVSVRESDPDTPTFLLPEADFGYKTYSAQLTNTSEFSGAGFENYLTVGLSAALQDRHGLTTAGAGIPYHAEGKTRTLGIFAQNEFVWNDRLTIIAGARMENQVVKPGDSVASGSETVEHTVFEPQIAALYKLNENWNVFGSATLVDRLPTVDEMFDTGSFGPPALPALGSLDPEEGLNLELGFSFAGNDVLTAGDALTFKTTAYRNDLTNLIGVSPDASPVTPYRVNIADALIQGVEIEGRYETERFFTGLGVSVIDGEDGDGNPLNSIPNSEIALDVGTRFPGSGLTLGWRSSFAMEIEHSGDEINDPYSVHSFYGSWEPKTAVLQGAEVRFGVDNIFDNYYVPALSAGAGKGRNFKISLAKTF